MTVVSLKTMWMRPVRRAAAVLATATLAAACGGSGGEALRAEKRVPLPDTVAADATLAIDSLGRAWIGEPGRLVVYDSAGRRAADLPAGGTLVPRVLWMQDSAVYVRAGRTVAAIDPATRRRTGSRTAEPATRDPRGRWIYTTGRGGGVLGLTPGSLQVRWGWPDPGSRAGAVAASPLGDRVYVALDGSEENAVEPSIEVRDALSGRVLSTVETAGPVRALEAGPDNTLYALLAGGEVTALRHGPDGLAPLWSARMAGEGLRAVEGLRVSPAGSRIAVLGRERGVRVLDAADGRVVGRTNDAPRDAAFDAAGRLWLLYAREIRIVP